MTSVFLTGKSFTKCDQKNNSEIQEVTIKKYTVRSFNKNELLHKWPNRSLRLFVEASTCQNKALILPHVIRVCSGKIISCCSFP